MSNSIKIGKGPKNRRSWAKTKQPLPFHGRGFEVTPAAVTKEDEYGVRFTSEDTASPPQPGQICLFIDDERPCPEGWTLGKSVWDFRRLLEQDDDVLAKVTHISLDWNLGPGQPDGVTLVETLAMRYGEYHDQDKIFLPNLKEIYFHSSDKDMAMKMRYHFIQIMDDLVDPSFKDRVRLRLRRW